MVKKGVCLFSGWSEVARPVKTDRRVRTKIAGAKLGDGFEDDAASQFKRRAMKNLLEGG